MVDSVNTVYRNNTKIIISVFYFAHVILSGMETKFFSASICSLQELWPCIYSTLYTLSYKCKCIFTTEFIHVHPKLTKKYNIN